MDTKVSDFSLRVCGQEGIRSELIERVRLMLEAVLKPVAKKGSSWVYIMTGPSEVFRHTSQYHLEIEPGSELSPRMVHVTMRASMLPNGSMHGMLQLPVDVHREKFIKAVASPIDILNRTGWNRVLPHEVREQAFDVGKPSTTTGLKSNPLVGVNPPSQPVCTPAPVTPAEELKPKKDPITTQRTPRAVVCSSGSQFSFLLTKKMKALDAVIRACIVAKRHQQAISARTAADRRALVAFDKQYAQYLT